MYAIRSYYDTDEKKEAFLIFLLESVIIPKKYSKVGPDFFREKDCHSYISKNIKKTKLMWVNSERKIVSLEKRNDYEVSKFTSNFLKNNLHVAIPKGLHEDIKKGFTVFLGTKNLPKSIKEVTSDLTSTDETFSYNFV